MRQMKRCLLHINQVYTLHLYIHKSYVQMYPQYPLTKDILYIIQIHRHRVTHCRRSSRIHNIYLYKNDMAKRNLSLLKMHIDLISTYYRQIYFHREEIIYFYKEEIISSFKFFFFCRIFKIRKFYFQIFIFFDLLLISISSSLTKNRV